MTNHGGTRPGAGRPPDYREPLRRVTRVPACGRLPESYIEQLRRSGQAGTHSWVLSEGAP